ncbi:MAG: pyruvoyl-dependent arginine decarboxylase, partial [Methanopyraceae archaeon]
AFDAALLDAGIGDWNLVELSSILPPGAEESELPPLPPGTIVPAVVARAVGRGPVASCVCVAKLESGFGVIAERAGESDPETVEEKARRDVEEMARARDEEIVEVKTATAFNEPEGDEWAAAVSAVVLWGRLPLGVREGGD